MKQEKSIEIYYKEFIESKNKLSSVDIDEILGFKTKKDKILSLFSIRYKDCIKLFNEGMVVGVYTYKLQYFINENSNYLKTWILYSPLEKYQQNADLYCKIAAKLEYFLNSNNKKYKKLIRRLNNTDNDFFFEKLPQDIFEDQLMVSTIYVKESTNPDLNLGFNLALLNRKQTKKMIYLPKKFIL